MKQRERMVRRTIYVSAADWAKARSILLARGLSISAWLRSKLRELIN